MQKKVPVIIIIQLNLLYLHFLFSTPFPDFLLTLPLLLRVVNLLVSS